MGMNTELLKAAAQKFRSMADELMREGDLFGGEVREIMERHAALAYDCERVIKMYLELSLTYACPQCGRIAQGERAERGPYSELEKPFCFECMVECVPMKFKCPQCGTVCHVETETPANVALKCLICEREFAPVKESPAPEKEEAKP